MPRVAGTFTLKKLECSKQALRLNNGAWNNEIDRKSTTSELQSHSDLVCRLLLEKKNKKKSLTRFRKVCVLTGRSRGLIKKEKVSRLKFKKLIEEGLLCGVRKSS